MVFDVSRLQVQAKEAKDAVSLERVPRDVDSNETVRRYSNIAELLMFQHSYLRARGTTRGPWGVRRIRAYIFRITIMIPDNRRVDNRHSGDLSGNSRFSIIRPRCSR